MCKRVAFSVMVLLLAGCASTYIPSSNMLQLKQGMDKDTAVAILVKHTKPSAENGGFCGSYPVTFDAGTPLTITPDGYSLLAYKRELISGEEVGGGWIRATYKKVYFVDGRKFSGLKTILVLRPAPKFGNCTVANTKGYTLHLLFGTSEYDAIFIGVAETGLDEVLAALSILAPQATLIQGLGFK